MNRTIAIIPARGGSKGIPKKNIAPFCGYPLIDHVMFAAEWSNVTEAYVLTDDIDIFNEIGRFKLKHLANKIIPLTRNPENAKDNSTTESVLLEFINGYRKGLSLEDTDDIILVQCTNPFLIPTYINGAMGMMTESRYDSIVSCSRLNRFLWKKNEAGEAKPINYKYWERPFRQDFKSEIYVENGSFYLNSVGNIKAFGTRLSGRIGIYEMPDFTAIELDNASDWITAEKIFDHYHNEAKNA